MNDFQRTRPFLIAALAFVAFAMVLGNPVLLAGGVFLLVLGLVVWSVGSPRVTRVERAVDRVVTRAEEAFAIRREISTGFGIGLVSVHDDVPDEMKVENGSNFQTVWVSPFDRRLDVSYELSSAKRGLYSFSPTGWETRGVWSADVVESGRCDAPLEVTVVARGLDIRRMAHIRAAAVSPFPVANPAEMGGETTDFREVRSYVPGDPFRAINWKASARLMASSAGLLVNKYEQEGKRAIFLFIDGADYMVVGTNLDNPMERAIEAAYGIARFYLTQGYVLGAYVYNNPAGFLSPDVGDKQVRRLARMLIPLEPEPANEHLPKAIEWCKRVLFRLQPEVVVITRLDAFSLEEDSARPPFRSLMDGLRRLRAISGSSRRRLRIWVISIGGDSYQGGDSREEELGRHLMHWMSRPMVNELRGAGFTLLEWDPHQEQFASAMLRHLFVSKRHR